MDSNFNIFTFAQAQQLHTKMAALITRYAKDMKNEHKLIRAEFEGQCEDHNYICGRLQRIENSINKIMEKLEIKG